MIAPMARITFVAFALLMASWPATVHAQDVPGIEICTVEKTMERRTSCLQSNVDFLQKTINKLTSDHQQKMDATNRQIEALKGAVIGLQKVVGDMHAAQNKAAEDAKKTTRAGCEGCGAGEGRREVATAGDQDTRYCSMTALSGS